MNEEQKSGEPSFTAGQPQTDLSTGNELQPGDSYMEGPYLVFTAQYHLRRGYCCNSDCRHCPYR